MLALTRKRLQTIIIDDGRIRITVMEISRDFVRLGIEAPDDVEINRGEIQTQIDIERSLISRP